MCFKSGPFYKPYWLPWAPLPHRFSNFVYIFNLNGNKINTVDSLLTDTSIRRTPLLKRTLRVGPCLSLLPLFDFL